MATTRFSWALAPALLAGIELAHPVIRAGQPGGLAPMADALGHWLAIHGAQLVLFPFAALAVASTLRGAPVRAAKVARVALGVFAIAYAAFDTFAGLGTGVLLQSAGPDARAQAETLAQAMFASGINAALFVTGTAAWTVGCGAAAWVQWQHGSRAAALLLAASGLLLWADHPPPWGPLTFGLAALGIAAAALRGAD